MLKLANKTMNTYRISGDEYTALGTGIKMRYESLTIDDTTRGLASQNRNNAFLIAYNMLVDTIDLKVSDKCEIVEDNKSFVVCGISDFGDFKKPHLEVLLRQLDSDFHEDIQIKSLKEVQPNYDPVFKQWASSKNYETVTIKALVDTAKPDTFPDLQSAGKLDNITYVVTLDLPITVNLSEKLVIRGEEFVIQEIMHLPYQVTATVARVLPHGNQFS